MEEGWGQYIKEGNKQAIKEEKNWDAVVETREKEAGRSKYEVKDEN